MAVTARRTLANVKSSARRPRQPEVPNLIGEVLMGRYFRPERVESRKLNGGLSSVSVISFQLSVGGEKEIGGFLDLADCRVWVKVALRSESKKFRGLLEDEDVAVIGGDGDGLCVACPQREFR